MTGLRDEAKKASPWADDKLQEALISFLLRRGRRSPFQLIRSPHLVFVALGAEELIPTHPATGSTHPATGSTHPATGSTHPATASFLHSERGSAPLSPPPVRAGALERQNGGGERGR